MTTRSPGRSFGCSGLFAKSFDALGRSVFEFPVRRSGPIDTVFVVFFW
jgi:hypothetical protein